MISIQPKNNSERENYKILTGTIIPRPIAFVTTISDEGVVNGAPFSYFNIVSSNPPLVSVAIQRANGNLKDTARNIYNNGEFVVHIVDQNNVKQVNETAASLPYNESELDIANLTQVPSDMINVPGVKESKVRFECKLVQALPLLNEENPGSDLFIGEVVLFHIDESIYDQDKRYIDERSLDAVSRLAGQNYATLGDIFSIKRPK
ncbi:flavin reductase family protein [Ureibacillus sp. 179-F W5.1 NHS]|uniref:Flavin reductase family protein n=1 Tax=Lysinibacillus halotolerans TaxID=1368476 RepID=A0A3M8H9D1_9BACI|nr:flavin reductase family protein [Lysinibacillus halotolerans]RNC99021.1 flavin reductase family protein [Lysinibacillus halotolerans]